MIPKDLFRKVRRIQITTSKMVTDVFSGQYHSVFKGRGMEFDEVREYYPGDDVRTIDWNVTARTGRPHVKKYIEERELTVMLIVDASMSFRFGSEAVLKSRLAAEVAALLAFSAIRNNDKVGLIVFTDQVEAFIPPRKGTRHVLRVIREILYVQAAHPGTDIPSALEYLSRVVRRRAVTFLLTDFLIGGPLLGDDRGARRLKQALATAGRRHDLVAVTIEDPRERFLPDCGGLVLLQDAETGARSVIDTAAPAMRERFADAGRTRAEQRRRLLQSAGVDGVELSTDVPYASELVKFFLKRRRRL